MTNVAGELVPGLLHGQLPVHLAEVGVVDGVDHREQVQGLGDTAVLGERLSERSWAAEAGCSLPGCL